MNSEDRDVCQNALRALCEEFRNPASIASCARAGVFSALPAFTLSSSRLTRERASAALALGSRDYNGRSAMLKAGFLTTIMSALDDESVTVRGNVYAALEGTARLPVGTCALVTAGYPAQLVAKARDECDALRPAVLDVLNNIVRSRDGAAAALEARAVDVLVALLSGTAAASVTAAPPDVSSASKQQAEAAAAAQQAACTVLCGAANALRELAFSDMGKLMAIECGGVLRLTALLSCNDANVRGAVLGALMAITTVDAGKRAFLAAEATGRVVDALRAEKELERLNALKLAASIVSHPGEMSERFDCM